MGTSGSGEAGEIGNSVLTCIR